MTDRYSQLVNNPVGRLVAGRVGLPQPTELRRGDPAPDGPVLLGEAPGGRLVAAAAAVLDGAQIERDAGVEAPGGIVFDASGIATPEDLGALRDFFHPVVRSLRPCGRVVLLGTPPEDCETPAAAIAQRALEGFVRALAKEIGRGSTANLVLAAPGAEHVLGSTLRFLLGARSAYVSGQVVWIGAADEPGADDGQPLAGLRALVTGGARGIGAAIAETLARDGADVVVLDVPALADDLGARGIALDLTDPDAPAAICERFADGIDIVVHNAGITRDRTLAKMPPDVWQSVLAVNICAPHAITTALLDAELLGAGARVVGVSSISGIAGNAGQTNYSTSKAAVIGMVDALGGALARRGATINAVAPGFIETAMTARMPIALREAGRRMNSLSQGGLPVDVAETVAWLAQPGSAGVNGNVIRVCGQSLIGA